MLVKSKGLFCSYTNALYCKSHSMGVLSVLRKNIRNIPGWQTKRKIVIIESDDWGSIRMPSKEAFKRLQKAGIPVEKCPMNSYDSLASEEDLSALFQVLQTVKDKNKNPAGIKYEGKVLGEELNYTRK